MRLALVAERLADLRCLRQDLLQARRLLREVVEHPQRARLPLGARLVVELVRVLVEPGAQLLEVRGAAVPVADRVQLEPPAPDLEAPQELGEELDHLGVDRRVVRPHRLDVELPELAELAALRRRVPVHGPDEEGLHRLWLSVQAVLDVRAGDRRRALRPERQRAVASVRECVHLFLDDVGAPAGRAREEPRVLE